MHVKRGTRKRGTVGHGVRFGAIVALMGSSVAACGDEGAPAESAPDEVVESAGGEEADGAGQDSPSSGDRPEGASDVDLPDWFFEHYPMQPGSKIENGAKQFNRDASYLVTLAFHDVDDDEAREWYTEQYNTDGWSVTDGASESALYSEKEVDGHEFTAKISFLGTDRYSIVQITAERV